MVNKYELVGIFLSIGLMALALFLLRIEDSKMAALPVTGDSQPALAIVSGDNDQDEIYKTLADAVDIDGNLQKLVVDDVRIGTGAAVTDGDTVVVHYKGTLPNGQEFDNSRNRGEAFTFTVGAGRVIAGWEEGIKGMQVGGQRILVIPPELAYGKAGAGPIPGNATLVFAIELLEIVE